jgi:dTDP-glucose pyrophosphorylase
VSERLTSVTIPPTTTVRRALEVIDRGACGIALVVDGDGRLVGTLTDGDVRRGLLRGAMLDSVVEPLIHRDFASVDERAGRAEVLDMMRARSLQQIPILDQVGRLVGLHLMREIIGAVERPNWAVIMAGGRGERLRPLTDSIPKPMVRVAGRPILERLVLHLAGFGVRRIFISVNYLADVIERFFGDGSTHGCRIEYLRELQPLGTGGALSLLPCPPADPLLVLNGDLVTQCDFGRMLSFHVDGRFRATVGIHEYVHTVPYGVVETDGHRVVVQREKPTVTWLANAGVYVLDAELLERVPKGVHFPLPALVEECLDRQEPVGAFRIEEDWVDVGHPVELVRARGETDKP